MDLSGNLKMRTIKFRAWDESQKYMAYQGTPDLETIQSFFHHFGDENLMQFTGLKDKNGKEIYEGDFIKDKEHIYIVSWHDEMATFVIKRKGWMFNHFFKEGLDNNDCEVAGNIYENTDLWKN